MSCCWDMITILVTLIRMEKEPTEPYTDDDLNWTNADSRVSREHAGQSNQIKSAAQRFSL